MKNRFLYLSAVALMASVLTAGCTSIEDSPSKIRAVAGIPPVAWAVEQVGGDLVEASVLLPSGASPETYSPTPQSMTALSDARLLFVVGVPFEQRLIERVQDFAGAIEVVDVSTGITLRHFEETRGDSDHDHGLADPHVWLDPLNMCEIVKNVATSLGKADAANGETYRLRADKVIEKLHSLDRELDTLLAILRGRSILVYHPSFGYFTDRYGLRQLAIERHGKEASARQLGELIAETKSGKISKLLVQPQFPRRQAEVLAAEVGASVTVVDPLAADYVTMMRELGAVIVNSFEQSMVEK